MIFLLDFKYLYMSDIKRIRAALISVYHKDRLKVIIDKLASLNVEILSTGGTKSFIDNLGVNAKSVESITDYPSILGGRVKTLHPKVFGGILARRDEESDQKEMKEFDVFPIDLVIVDLYPFEKTIEQTDDLAEIIEKIDIGGISLIRAAAKNYQDVLVVSSMSQYDDLIELLDHKNGETTLADRKKFAVKAFGISSHYDSKIYGFLEDSETPDFKQSVFEKKVLRYGENPHQKGVFYGDFDEVFDKLHGKDVSYNNLLDIDAAIHLIAEFEETTFAVLKHNNPCGVASRENLKEAWINALAGDPVSAFGGILVTNREIDKETAEEINKIFFEVIIAPSYNKEAFDILAQKKNRIILIQKKLQFSNDQFRSLLNGVLWQEKDNQTERANDLNTVTKLSPSEKEITDLIFANKIVKHSKSNTIVLAKDKRLSASGVGQTSRVDALRQAITKANGFGFNLEGAVMASDAFFPFSDSVEIAYDAGIAAVLQPGGSIRDQESIDFCNSKKISMVFTGTRHFKH
jgi:phosphoribosylaminoimidazolecarboxamide formyltransferase/IMP cyclohydrolase